MSRANDPAIKDILRHMREINIQNPDYDAIKNILENGVDGRYTNCYMPGTGQPYDSSKTSEPDGESTGD